MRKILRFVLMDGVEEIYGETVCIEIIKFLV